MIDVQYLRHSGDDLAVVNAARVSFDAESDYVCTDMKIGTYALPEQDEKLIDYLARHKHKSPFNHAFVSFRVTAPIFIARQLVKHEYLPWNEVSRRYVEGDLEFYWPEDRNDWRSQPDAVKQGSGNPVDWDAAGRISMRYSKLIEAAKDCYFQAIADGLCREQARMFLPQSLMTTWIWSGSVYAFAKMCQLRLDGHAQREASYVAQPILNNLKALFPVSTEALLKHGAN
jgi:thymidylate synthase (FAD)